jgi:hypothetical protein
MGTYLSLTAGLRVIDLGCLFLGALTRSQQSFSPLTCRVFGYHSLTVTNTRPIGPGGCQGNAPLYLYATCHIEQDITQKVTEFWHGNATGTTNPLQVLDILLSVTRDLTTASSFPSRILKANSQGTSWCTLKLIRRLGFTKYILLTRPRMECVQYPS